MVGMGSDLVYEVYEIFYRDSDASYDLWLTVCPSLVPEDKARSLLRVLRAHDVAGERVGDSHTLCMPKEYDIGDQILTQQELKEVQDFDLTPYRNSAPPEGAARVVKGRYVWFYDY